MISARRSGIVNSTPRMPPKPAINVVSRYGNALPWSLFHTLRITSAGSVKITPDARPSPDAAAVCTALFCKILPRRRARRIPIEITAAGTDADTVMPANMPRYAFAPARITDNKQPKMITPAVSSGSDLLAGMYGSTFCGVGLEPSDIAAQSFGNGHTIKGTWLDLSAPPRDRAR